MTYDKSVAQSSVIRSLYQELLLFRGLETIQEPTKHISVGGTVRDVDREGFSEGLD